MATEKNYVLGSGKLYFEQYLNGAKTGAGQRYLGNTTEFTLSRAETTLDHWDTDNGKKTKDVSVSLQEDTTGKFTTDNVSGDNLALWFAGAKTPLVVGASTALTDSVASSSKSMRFQIGKSTANPIGLRNLANLVVKIGGTTIAANSAVDGLPNYVFDPVSGALTIGDTATDIPDGSLLALTFDQTAYTREMVITNGQQVEGGLYFFAKNQKGIQRNFHMPYVKLTANGDYALKGDTWQTMSFNVEVLQRDDATQRLYIDKTTTS